MYWYLSSFKGVKIITQQVQPSKILPKPVTATLPTSNNSPIMVVSSNGAIMTTKLVTTPTGKFFWALVYLFVIYSLSNFSVFDTGVTDIIETILQRGLSWLFTSLQLKNVLSLFVVWSSILFLHSTYYNFYLLSYCLLIYLILFTLLDHKFS